MDYTSASVVI